MLRLAVCARVRLRTRFRRLASILIAENMRFPRNRLILVCGLIAILAAAIVPLTNGANGSGPVGPRLALVKFFGKKSAKGGAKYGAPFFSLSTVSPSGEESETLAQGRDEVSSQDRVVPVEGQPSWSADGARIAFVGTTSGSENWIYVASADGSEINEVPETYGTTNPVLSPDGRVLVFARFHNRFFRHERSGKRMWGGSASIWRIDLQSGKQRRLTRWQNGVYNTPSSFTPDGSKLAITREVRPSNRRDDEPRRPGDFSVLLIGLDGGDPEPLARAAAEPAISPDGSSVAYLSLRGRPYGATRALVSDLSVTSIEGTSARRLTRTRDRIELAPSWDPSGQRLAYIDSPLQAYGRSGIEYPFGNSIRQVNADGTCSRKTISQPDVVLYGAAWQPGASREAGRIEC
jgi:Tol biopolymer transport system component